MTDTDNFVTLAECDAEDIEDFIGRIEKSFGIKFETEAFAHINTFGDLCNVFEQHIAGENKQDCTSQQAFYRVRYAISTLTPTGNQQILPDSKLQDFFPSKKRHRSIKQFRNSLGIKIPMLTYPDQAWYIIAGIFICSLTAFFFNWKFALAGLLFGILLTKLSDRLGNVLIHHTVRDLVKELTSKHYSAVRRNSGSVNKNEIHKLIIDTFSQDLGIDKASLTKDAPFSWYKVAS